MRIPQEAQTQAHVGSSGYPLRPLPFGVVDGGAPQHDAHPRVGAVQVVDGQRLFVGRPSDDEDDDVLGPATKARGSRSNPAAARGAEAPILLPALPRPCLISAVRPRAERRTRPAPCIFCSRTKAAPSLHHPPSLLQFSALRNLRGDDFCRICGEKAWVASWLRGSIHHSSRSVSLQRTRSRHNHLPAAASEVLPALQIGAFIRVQPLAAATKASGTPLPCANSGSVTKQPEHEAGMAPERTWAPWLRLLPAEPTPVRQGSSSEREHRGFGSQKTGL